MPGAGLSVDELAAAAPHAVHLLLQTAAVPVVRHQSHLMMSDLVPYPKTPSNGMVNFRDIKAIATLRECQCWDPVAEPSLQSLPGRRADGTCKAETSLGRTSRGIETCN